MKACRAGHLCTVKFLIDKGANPRKQTTNNDHTPLSLACAGGHLPVVQLLLENNADPNHKLKVRAFCDEFKELKLKSFSVLIGQFNYADRGFQRRPR